MVAQKKPCEDGLTPACFAAHPEWAKQVFAFRLLNAVAPFALSRALPRLPLSIYILFPPDWTPGDLLPDSVIVDTSVIFPTDWRPGDPLPEGVIVPEGFTWPQDWKPGDPLPEGVIVDTSVIFPADWKLGDPLPVGILPNPAIYPNIPSTGAIAPIYIAIWEPGPNIHPGRISPPIGETWFSEPFNDLTTNSWIDNSVPTGQVSIVNGWCSFYGNDSGAIARIYRDHPSAFPENWSYYGKIEVENADSFFTSEFYTGTYHVGLRLLGTDTAALISGRNSQSVTLDDFTGEWHEWRIEVIGNSANLYQDNDKIIENFTLEADTNNPGRMNLDARGICQYYYDYLKMTEP